MKRLAVLVFMLGAGGALSAGAQTVTTLSRPAAGVLCDRHFCADATGVSLTLTQRYLGEKPYQALQSAGQFNRTQFTFENGVFCDVAEKLCREDRYFGLDGKRSGAVHKGYTQALFAPGT